MIATSAAGHLNFTPFIPENSFSALAQRFSLPEKKLQSILQVASPVVQDLNGYLKTQNPVDVAYKTHEQVLTGYKAFVQTASKHYAKSCTHQRPLQEELAAKRWQLFTGDVINEAGRLVEAYGQSLPGKLQLLKSLKQVAESVLFPAATAVKPGWAKTDNDEPFETCYG